MNIALKNVKLIVLDLDDTLILERDFAFSAFDFIENHLSIKNLSSTCKNIYLNETKNNIFNLAFKRLSLELSESDLQSIINLYRTHSPDIKLLPDAEQFLVMARNAKYKLAVITDGFEITQKNKIEVIGLDKYVDKIIITDSLDPSGVRKYWKPHARSFDLIEEHFDCRGEECVYIGDNINKDFIVPQKKNWSSVLICRNEGVYSSQESPEGIIKITSLAGLLEN